MAPPTPAEVDDYIAGKLLGDDPAIRSARAENAAAGLPAIDVSDTQGKFLQLLAAAVGARRILEVGTLGGVSTIFLARALPAAGALVTLEIDPRHAAVARRNLDNAGVGDRVDIRVGAAADVLAAMRLAGEAPFDLVFVDADKQGNVAYVEAAIALGRRGTVIVVDNVVREGAVVDTDDADPKVAGTRALYDYVAREPRLDATAIQTQGAKHWDGFLMAVVR